MNKKRFLIIIFSILFIALLLLFPSTAIIGSRSGLILWFQILLPTLLPYFILSSLLRTMLPPKKSTAFFIGIGLFSGYPVGAKMVGEEYHLGNLSYRSSIFFLAFCNQASAVFVLSYVGNYVLNLGSSRYTFLGIVMLSTCLGSYFASRFFKEDHIRPYQNTISAKETASADKDSIKDPPLFKRLDQIILESFVSIAKIGGYVILFSILAGFVSALTFGDPYINTFSSGIMEITTGANSLLSASIPENHKIVLASA